MSRCSLLLGALASVSLVAVSTACAAQDRSFNLPAGPLVDVLPGFAIQSGVQVLYSPHDVAGRDTRGLRGLFTPEAGLTRLLTGSGLEWTSPRPGVFVVRARTSERAETPELEDVVVTGTLLKRSGPPASPVIVLGRDELDQRGQGTVAETLASLPQNYAGSGTPGALLSAADPAGGNSAMATGINLRGLGADSTLTLVNGRRLAGSGSYGELGDVSALPSAAVERVDVLLDGASALYGSDAVAGVVNVIMRRRFDGAETRLRAAAAKGGAEDLSFSHLAGRSWSSGSALLAYEYQALNPLNMRDRPYTADGDLRPFGGSNRGGIYSAPGNIVVFDAARGGYVVQYGVRPGPDGSAETAADFAPGEANLMAPLDGLDLLPRLERHSLYGRVRQSLGQRLDLSADLRFSRREAEAANPPPNSTLTVTAANPHFVSPTGAASHLLTYSFVRDIGNPVSTRISRSLGVTAGATYALDAGWSVDGYLAFAEERGQRTTTGSVNSLFLAEALGNRADNPATAYVAARDGYFNPFGDGEANGAAVLAFIGSGSSRILDRSRSQSANLMLEGPLLSLPGGDLQIALGAQVRKESFSTRTRAFTATATPVSSQTPQRERTVSAVFAELRAPLVSEANRRPGVERLELSVAGRFEDYDDVGSTANPKVGLVWSPHRDLAVRTSYGTSFKAPALPQLFDAAALTATTLPGPDGSRILSLYRYGGNPDLSPETATTWSAGLDYAPEGGLRASLGYFDTAFTDRIAQPVNENLNGALIDPALAPFVQRVSPATNPEDLALIQGLIATPGFPAAGLYPPTAYGAVLDGRWVNAASVDVRGLDGAISAPLRFDDHEIVLDASAAYLLDYRMRTTATAPERSVVGRVGYPVRLRARAGGVWTRGDVSVAAHWNHVAAYEDGAGRAIAAWNTIDAQLAWRRADGLRLSLSVQNLLDADPPLYDSVNGLGFDPGQANVLGRVISLQLIQRW